MKYGYPGTENIKVREGHVLSLDRRNKNAHWVCEMITASTLSQNNASRKSCHFWEDQSEPEMFRAKLSDYKRSGFDRGHMTPAGDHHESLAALHDTFSLSNMSPQVGEGFNRGIWEKLETHCRQLTSTHDRVYICTGPLYLPTVRENGRQYVKYEVIGAGRVSVPTHFFKTVLCENDNGKNHIEAYIMPNVNIPGNVSLTTFQVPLQDVERSSGHLFFDSLANKYQI